MLTNKELDHVLNSELQMNHAERTILLTALNARVCGVVRKSIIRQSTNLCLERGLMEHGWRCGKHGHVGDVYFEGKAQANPSALKTVERSRLRTAEECGVHVNIISEPDFSVIGRQSVRLHPRIWHTPERNTFVVRVIGFEFRVHPSDPRARPQIEAAVEEWNLHAAVIQQVVWEMLELYGVERASQPLKLQPYEMGHADVPEEYSSAFTSMIPSTNKNGNEWAKGERATLKNVTLHMPREHYESSLTDKKNESGKSIAQTNFNSNEESTNWTTHKEHAETSTSIKTEKATILNKLVLPISELTSEREHETIKPHERHYTIVEQRMLGLDGKEKPWFATPLPQHFDNGVPTILPFAPSLIIHSSFRQVKRELITEDITSQLFQPVLDMTCLVHPRSCFWWNAEDEEKCVRQILDYAKRVPFALPFNLYLRVDTTQSIRDNPKLEEEMNEYYKTKAKYFDLREFTSWYRSVS